LGASRIGLDPPVLEISMAGGCVRADLTIPVDEFHAAAARHFPEIPERVLREGAGMRVGPAEQAVLRGLPRQLEEATVKLAALEGRAPYGAVRRGLPVAVRRDAGDLGEEIGIKGIRGLGDY
jgi:hypothetical protein